MVRLFLYGGLSYLNSKPKGGSSNDGYEIGIKPGIALDLSDKIRIVFRFGFVSYRNNYGADISDLIQKSNGFGLGISGQDLSLGIQLKF